MKQKKQIQTNKNTLHYIVDLLVSCRYIFLYYNIFPMKVLYRIFLILLVVGGVNRGLYAWLDLNLVATVFPDVVTKSVGVDGVETVMTSMNMIAKIIYSLVAVGGIRTLVANFGCNGDCKKA